MHGITAAPTALLDDVSIIRRALPPGLVSTRGLYAQTFGYIEGAPGLGKTFMMIDLGFQIALGADWLGASVERSGDVVGVAAEGASWIGSRMRAWKQHHGYPIKKVHDFRRTAARNLERAGVSRSVAMAMIGHKTESMYRRYSIVDEARRREEAEKYQAWATGQQKPAKGSGKVRQFKKRASG